MPLTHSSPYTIIASSNEICSPDCAGTEAQPNAETPCGSGSDNIGAKLNGTHNTFQSSDDRFVGDVDLSEGMSYGLDRSCGLTLGFPFGTLFLRSRGLAERE